MENILKKIDKEVDLLKDDLIRDIKRMIAVESDKASPEENAPFGKKSRNALSKAMQICEELGFETKVVKNAMGYAKYGDGDEYVGIFGHIDTVPVGLGWHYDPLGGEIENGKIYGRGVLDNKGPIISALYGLYTLKKLGIKLKKPVRIVFGTDEETGMEDTKLYLSEEKPPIAGFTPDCKYPVVYAERGRARISMGIKYDNSNYDERIKEFFEYVDKYMLRDMVAKKLKIDFSDDEYGITEVRNFNIENKNNEMKFLMSVSYIASKTSKDIECAIKKTLSKNMFYKLESDIKPVKFDKDSLMVKQMQKAYNDVTGEDAKPVTTTGGTYAKLIPGIVPFGPSFPGQKGISHNPDEWMNIDDLILNCKIYANAIYNLAN